MDSAARSAETVNAWHTAGRMSRQPRQRQRYFVSFARTRYWRTTGPLNARDVAQLRPGVAMVFGFDTFNELAHARTIAGRVFGIDFSVPAERLVALQEMAERWASPE